MFPFRGRPVYAFFNGMYVKRAFIVGRKCVHKGVVPLTLCPIGCVLNVHVSYAEGVSIKG